MGQDTMPEEIWNRPISAILESLGATASGLSRAEVDTRRRQYGLNQPLAHRRRPLWLQFLARFLNPLVLILLFASALSAATGNVTSFVIVIVMVVLSVTLDFVQEMRAGEPYPAEKRVDAPATPARDPGEAVNTVFMGTSVISGSALAVVC